MYFCDVAIGLQTTTQIVYNNFAKTKQESTMKTTNNTTTTNTTELESLLDSLQGAEDSSTTLPTVETTETKERAITKIKRSKDMLANGSDKGLLPLNKLGMDYVCKRTHVQALGIAFKLFCESQNELGSKVLKACYYNSDNLQELFNCSGLTTKATSIDTAKKCYFEFYHFRQQNFVVCYSKSNDKKTKLFFDAESKELYTTEIMQQIFNLLIAEIGIK